MRVAALLKGVNVGGNRKLAMADLRAFIEGLGYGPATTLLASGNVIFETDIDAAALEPMLAEQAKAALGLDTAWFVRSHAELAAVVAANPFPDAALARPSHVLVAFHHTPFPAALLDDLAASYAGPERLACVGRELFVDYPAAIGRATLPQATAKLKFPAVGTARNWNTVEKLAELTA